MTSDENQSPETEQDRADAAQDTAAAAPQPDAEAAAAALAAENAELKDRVLRMAAEMDNLRKRTEREIADARNYAIAGFARDMLTATDNLNRALTAVPSEAREAADATMAGLIEGIEMTEREMHRLLQKNGVKPVEAQGVKFDPHKHQAVFEVPDDSVPEGTVVQVMQAGFSIGDRILRPAMVGVAKGGPKMQTPPKAEETPQAGAGAETDPGVDKQA